MCVRAASMRAIDVINKLARPCAARTNIAIIENAVVHTVLHYELVKAGCIACAND